ncbi:MULTISPECIES: glycosyltransferase [Kitasatospora]|uniref:Hyaluronan synthase n=1 Tax=Kitasatospora setae (strain ATCC 33774 / DSM 43861 / JCM 3304 / KCC A-0304 / NBRC 14216 / KM-6054) TaxID=452652 RepID=E4N774_KITSK|nr:MULTISPECIES: glycosyltransferase [Kitasatospora]BAJ27055.1 putative glycosyltransferase [Kitasatospora setae KM-6054]
MARVTPASALRRRTLLLLGTAALALAYLAAHHVLAAGRLPDGDAPPLATVYALAFGWFLLRTVLAYLERPYRATPAQQAALDRAHLAALVPVYNEDPGWLRRCLDSLLRQTRPPDSIHVVDDGSTVDYTAERDRFRAACAAAGIRATWQRTPNRGKRAAQSAASEQAPEADYFLTLDSDADLDPAALHELLQPFADARTQSVAGVVLAANARTNTLTRCTDLYLTTCQLNERSCQSVLGSVLVNSGALAAYRAPVLREHRELYLTETFLGRQVVFSDDSMLTLFAKLRGRTVQQPTAFALSAMPETLGHHLRQQLRWMRGSAIRTCWRLRHLPLNGYAFWLQAAHLFLALAGAAAFLWLCLARPLTLGPASPWHLLAVPVALSYVECLRYLTVRRHDHTPRQQLATFALAPLTMLWVLVVLRALRWYGAATCARTGWGTRGRVELHTAPSPPAGERHSPEHPLPG